MVVLPYYLHDYKAFGRITVLGEFLAIAALIVCLLSVVVDLGQPGRILNVWIHFSPHSVLFWDTIVLNGYLFLNLVVGWNVLQAERNGTHYPMWVKPFIYISIPWAVSIHTVTAFLYCGLPGRHFWLGVDLVVGGAVFFFPLVADTARFARDQGTRHLRRRVRFHRQLGQLPFGQLAAHDLTS